MTTKVSSFTWVSPTLSSNPDHPPVEETTVQPIEQVGMNAPCDSLAIALAFRSWLLAYQDNHHAAVTIGAGETLDVIGPATDDRFVVVQVKGESSWSSIRI